MSGFVEPVTQPTIVLCNRNKFAFGLLISFAGTKDKKGTPGVKGNPGHLAMKFFNLRDRNVPPVFVMVQNPNNKVYIHSLAFDLKKGTIRVDSNEKDVVQYVALAFVTSTLYLLVQPRPPVLPDKSLAAKRGSRSVCSDFGIFRQRLALFSQCSSRTAVTG